MYCVTVPSGYVLVRRRGHVLVSGNSQQEYRLIVHFAHLAGMRGAERAVAAYRDDPDTDFHDFVVRLTGLERKPAKDTNFAKSYGAGVPKFALMIGKSQEEARAIYEQYDREMPFVSEVSQYTARLAGRRGYLRLLDGARAHFDHWEVGYLPKDKWTRGREAGQPMGPCRWSEAQRRAHDPEHVWHGERLRRAETHKALNRLIQGSAARQTKMAMRECWRAGLLPMLQMHDDLNFSCSEEAQGLRAAQIMRDVVALEVPVKVDVEWGVTWGRAAADKSGYGATWGEAWEERS